MRKVIALALVLAACSSSGDGLATGAPDAMPAASARGYEAPGPDVRQAARLDARTAFQDSLAADTLAPAASPDSLPGAPDTYVAPPPPPVTWESGPDTTDPALMVCPPTKGNSLGIGKACSNDVGGTRCPSGLTCLCGGELGPVSTPMVTKSMPCMCTAIAAGGPNATASCPPCGEGAGCCTLRNVINTLWACMPNACADAYCRPFTAGAR